MEMSKIGRASQLNTENAEKSMFLMNILAEVCRLLFSGTQRNKGLAYSTYVNYSPLLIWIDIIALVELHLVPQANKLPFNSRCDG